MICIRKRHGFQFYFTLLISLVCFDVTTQRQISQGYSGPSYTSVGHDGTLNGQLTDVQKHVLENGGSFAHDGRQENIQPLRTGGEDPLRLQLVFMAEVSNSGKGNSSVNQTTKPEREIVHSPASLPSSMNLRVSDQYSPHGDIVRLDSHGILVAQKRRNRAPIPQRTSSNDAGRIPTYRKQSSVIPSPPAKAQARRYKEEAPRPVLNQKPLRPRNIFKPLSPQSPGFTPLERLTDRRRTLSSNLDPPRRPETQRDPPNQPRNRVSARQQPFAPGNIADPYRRSQRELYPPQNDRYQTRYNGNEAAPARRLGEILSDMGHTRYEPAPLPSRHADSRPYPIQYTIPDSATPTEMRVRRIQQPEIARTPDRYLDHATDRVRVRPEPATHYHDNHQPVSSNTGVAIPDTYSDNVRALPQASRDPIRSMNRQTHIPRTEARAPSVNSVHIPRQHYQQTREPRTEARAPSVNHPRQPYQQTREPRTEARAPSVNRVHIPRQNYQKPTSSLNPNGESPKNATGELVVISMQENADGTITYTVADPRKAKADRINNLPIQVKKQTASHSNSNVYDRTQQQPQSMYDQPQPQQQPHSVYDQPQQQPQTMYDQTQSQQQPQSMYDQPQQQPQSMYDQPQQQPQSMYDQPQQQPQSMYDQPQQQPQSMYDQPQQQPQTMYEQPQQQAHSMYDQPQQQPHSMYDQPQQQPQSMYDQPQQQPQAMYDQPQQQPHSMYDQPQQQRQTMYDRPQAQSQTQYQSKMVASAASVPFHQTASQTQVQQNQASQTQQIQGMNVIPRQDSGTRYNPGAATSSGNTQVHISSVAREQITYDQSPTSEVSASITETPKSMNGNYTIDDGVVYRVTEGNDSVPIEVVHTPMDNATGPTPSAARPEPAVRKPGEVNVEPSRPGSTRSYVLSENGGYAFRKGPVPSNPNSGGGLQYPGSSSQVNLGYGSQPVGVSIQETTPSPRSNLQVLKDIVKISGGTAAASQVLGAPSNIAGNPPVTQQHSSIHAPNGNPLVEAARGLTKLQALKALECFPVTVSNNVYCQSSCLPFQNCVSAGNILFCCPPFVTESVVQFKMMERTVEGMSDSL